MFFTSNTIVISQTLSNSNGHVLLGWVGALINNPHNNI